MNLRLSSALLLVLIAPAARAESIDTCTGVIAALPAVITTPGTWCLAGHLNTAIASGAAVQVNADNVTIDCHDFRISGLAAGAASSATGISAANRQGSTVRNCSLTGFHTALRLTGAAGARQTIADNLVSGNLVSGIQVEGDGSLVRGNRVLDTGGSTAFPGSATGILATGIVDVVDNTVQAVMALPLPNGTYSGSGIRLRNGTGAVVRGNRVRNIVGNVTISGGIRLVDTADAAIVGNHVVDAQYAVECLRSASHTYQNLFVDVATAVSGCSAVANRTLP